MKDGIFKGVIADWGVSKSSTGTPSVNVEFSIDIDGSLETITWFGYLTEKAKARTIETLFKLGFNGDLEGLTKGRETKALEGGKEVMITVESELYKDETKYKVKWVNLPGESHGVPKLETPEAMTLLNQFKADFMAAKPKAVKLGRLDLV